MAWVLSSSWRQGTIHSVLRNRWLQLVRHHLHPWRPRTEYLLLDIAFPDLVSAEGVKHVFVFTADGDGVDAAFVGDGEDDLAGMAG